MTTFSGYIPPAGLAGTGQAVAKDASPGARKEAVKEVAREFEALFVGMMLKSMRETVGKDSLTGGGHGEEMYRSMLDQEYAVAIAQGDGLGLAGLIEKQLERQMGYDTDNETRTKP